MRVGLVIYGRLETRSGGYLYDRKLVEYLEKKGDELKIVSLPWLDYSHHLLQNISNRWRGEISQLDVNVLLEDELNHPSLFRLNRYLRGCTRYPLISIVHHLRSNEEHPKLLSWFYRQIEREYVRTVDGCIFNSETTRGEVEKLVGRAVMGVVATPAGDRFGVLMDEGEIIRRSGQTGPLKLLFIGNLIPRKGLHTVIAALGSLSAENWVLQIIGRDSVDPGYVKRLKNKILQTGLQDRIKFLGEVPDVEMAHLMADSELLVMPSSYEGFGIVYLEGMAFGLPSIASLAGGAQEIIQNGQNGYLVKPGDINQLTAILLELCRNRELLLKLSLQARRDFSNFPTWEVSMEKVRQFLLTWEKYPDG